MNLNISSWCNLQQMLYEDLSAPIISKIKARCKRGRNELKRESVASLSALLGGRGGSWTSKKRDAEKGVLWPHRSPKVIPNLSQTLLKVVSKLSQKFPKVVSKLSQCFPKVFTNLNWSTVVSSLYTSCLKIVSKVSKSCHRVVSQFSQVVPKPKLP